MRTEIHYVILCDVVQRLFLVKGYRTQAYKHGPLIQNWTLVPAVVSLQKKNQLCVSGDYLIRATLPIYRYLETRENSCRVITCLGVLDERRR